MSTFPQPPSTYHNVIPVWGEAPLPVAYLSRKALPIKRNDAESLTREDVQFALLHHLFSDRQAVFTDPLKSNGAKLTFSDLYISALYNSTKCSKVLKDKMQELPAFSLEFAKISLLTNVGRINTTMAFFPEMKTPLRTYHPVPSLQKTEGNAQDAPRIKNCLKAAVLASEVKTPPPSSPEEVLDKLRAGLRPSTSVVNLVFVLANHAAPLSSVHFDGTLNFLDLFLPNTQFASADRGRAFLWLLYHYLESENPPNPFDDQHSKTNSNKIPRLRILSSEEYIQENIDTKEEIHWGNTMSKRRNVFLRDLLTGIVPEIEKKSKNATFVPAITIGSVDKGMPKFQHYIPDAVKDDREFLFYIPKQETQPLPTINYEPKYIDAYQSTKPKNHRQETMFQHAWKVVSTTDPLADSDEEINRQDKLDYTRRLSIIERIRRRLPLASTHR